MTSWRITAGMVASALVVWAGPHPGWQRSLAIAVVVVWALGAVVSLVRSHLIEARTMRGRAVGALRSMDEAGWWG